MDFDHSLQALVTRDNIFNNPTRESLIEEAVRNKEALVSACGALATWTPVESTGRSPLDTLTVRRPESEKNID